MNSVAKLHTRHKIWSTTTIQASHILCLDLLEVFINIGITKLNELYSPDDYKYKNGKKEVVALIIEKVICHSIRHPLQVI